MFKSKSVALVVAILTMLALPAFAAAQKNLPVLSSIAPISTSAGVAVTITANGSNFASGSIILWNGVGLTTTYYSATKLTAPLASTQVGVAGTDKVSVYTPGRFGGTSAYLSFTVNPATTTTTTTSTTSTTTTTTTTVPLAISSTSVPTGTTGTAYSAALGATGGTAPYTWSLAGGTLPAGLTMSSTGAITGTPTTSGSYSFMAAVKDAASNMQSYTYSTSIAQGTSITTASVPNGTAGTAYPATTLSATGGTGGPYTWALASGTMPPGLTLASTGSISGTPTTAAGYTFALQAKDASNNTSTKTFSMTVTAPTTTSTTSTTTTILYSEDFESGSLAKYPTAALWSWSNPFLATAATGGFVHSGNYSYGQRFNGNALTASDVNRWLSVILPAQTEVWTRGWVYIKSPEADATPPLSSINQRKLIEWGDTTDPTNCCGSFLPLLDTWNDVGGVATNNNQLEFVTAPCGNPSVAHYNIGSFPFDSWHEVEVHLKLDTGNTANGVVDVWLDGANTYHSTTEILRGTCTTAITGYFFGRQVDNPANTTLDEYRYWDDIAVGTGYLP